MIWAAFECDPATDIICKPEFVNELFETHTIFSIGGFEVNRAILLMFLAAFVAIGLLWFAFRKPRVVPTKFGAAMEAVVGFVRDEIAIGIIGPTGIKYFPYLLSVFLFVLIGNLFEVTPFINFPITSRMAIPLFLSLLTYFIFVGVGIAKNGFHYFSGIAWPKSVPAGLRPLVGLIELVSTFVLRPITLAVRLFANLVAGHVMLTLLLASGVVFISQVGDIGFRSAIGLGWFTVGMAIFIFEIAVAALQAYIFTLLSAVYIQTSVHPEH
ncbi:MAG: F0F1 ATP synthase subunit A [Acidimicrobiia bacterium]